MTTRTLLSLLLISLLGLSPSFAQAQEKSTVEVILVMASNSGQGVDASLKPYADNLQRLFRFSTYEQKDKKTLTIETPGGMNTQLFGGTDLQIGLQAIADNKLPANLDWKRGKERLLRTMIRLSPNTPAIVGGASGDGNAGTYLLIIQWRP